MNSSTALCVVSRDRAREAVCWLNFAKESITKNRALNVKRNQKQQENANINNSFESSTGRLFRPVFSFIFDRNADPLSRGIIYARTALTSYFLLSINHRRYTLMRTAGYSGEILFYNISSSTSFKVHGVTVSLTSSSNNSNAFSFSSVMSNAKLLSSHSPPVYSRINTE